VHVHHLSEFAEKLRNASQSLGGSSEVSVLKDQLHQLGVASAHCFLQHCTQNSTHPSGILKMHMVGKIVGKANLKYTFYFNFKYFKSTFKRPVLFCFCPF